MTDDTGDKIASLEEMKRRREQAALDGDPDLLPPIKVSITYPELPVDHHVHTNIDLRLPGLLACLLFGFIGGVIAVAILI